jgi:hypothetical protein
MKTVLALAACLAFASACKKDTKPDTAAPATAEKPTAPGSDQAGSAATPTPTPTPTPPPVKLGASGLPKECDDYKAGIEKLKSCAKISVDAKDSLVQAYEAASAGWAKLPEDSRKNLASTCKAAVESVEAVMKTQCP